MDVLSIECSYRNIKENICYREVKYAYLICAVCILHISYHYMLTFVHFDETMRQIFRCLKHLPEDTVIVETEQEKLFKSNVYLRICTLVLFLLYYYLHIKHFSCIFTNLLSKLLFLSLP